MLWCRKEGRKANARRRRRIGYGQSPVVVHRFGAVRTLLRNFFVIGHDEQEALAVDDMPVERIELNAIAPASDAGFFLPRVKRT